MYCVLVALGLLTAGVSLILWASAMTESRSRFNSAYRAVAASLRGHTTLGRIWGYPQLSFTHGAARGHVSLVRQSGVWVTQLRLQPMELPFQFEIVPQNRGFVGAPGIWRAIALENKQLDDRFRARTSDDAAFRKAIAASYRQLQLLDSASGQNALYVLGQGRLLTIRVEQRIYDWRVLLELVKFGCELFDQLHLGADESIQFVEEVEATLLVDVVCPICGDPIESDLVYCSSCKTPHHRECWEYNTRCATFACGKSTYLVPQIARPIESAETAERKTSAE